MPLAINQDAGRLYVQGEMTIYAAGVLKEQLFAAVRELAGAAVLDLSGVSEIDTAGLQTLLLAQRVAVACGTQLQLVEPSEAVREALELCGLRHLLPGSDVYESAS